MSNYCALGLERLDTKESNVGEGGQSIKFDHRELHGETQSFCELLMYQRENADCTKHFEGFEKKLYEY